MKTLLLIFCTILFFSLAVLSWILYKIYNKLKTANSDLEQKTEDYSRLLSQKKSSEVRLGLISEKLAPFLDDFDFDPKHLTFLGNPIDYVHFGEDSITFIEVKSGKSRLSSKQRRIRDNINAGNINWHIFRID